MTYEEALTWMYSQLPMYQREGKMAFKKDLTNILAFTAHLNNPHQKFKSIHIAGTNGKGSTAHMLASILQEAGYKVGLYTSPHLKDFRERIKINGKCIRKNCVINFVKRNKVFLEKQGLSFFEMTVGLAFEHFAKKQVDIAIVEVGLGGRLDSTNILNPELSIITNIGYDHQNMLGNTLPEIASEKAGIIKKDVPLVIGEYQEEVFEVFLEKSKKQNVEIYLGSDYRKNIPEYELQGNYQLQNIKTVLQSIAVLQKKNWLINEQQIKNGLNNVVKNTGIMGRWQILSKHPIIVTDTAHNAAGLKYTLTQIDTYTFDKLHIVLGVVNDKNLDNILRLFPKNAIYYFSKPDVPRGLDCTQLKKQAKFHKLQGDCYQSVNMAFLTAKKKANENDFIYIGGSTFVVAEVL